jgi:hypothetical protein
MKFTLKRLFWIAWIVLICGPLLYAFMYIGVDGRWGCLGTRYERFDIFTDGVRQRGGFGAAPWYSIMDLPVTSRSVKAYDAFYNVTDLMECAREEKYAARISFVELRSAALTRMVAQWRTHHDPASGFRSGNMWKDRVIVSYSSDWPTYRVWDPAYVKAAAPGWMPVAQLTEANLIAFWGDGHLFQGAQPDQYYWVGYR